MDVLEELLRASKTKYVSPMERAMIYMALGEKDQAFRYIQQAADDRCWSITLITVDPAFDSLRSDPRYHQLERRLGLNDG